MAITDATGGFAVCGEGRGENAAEHKDGQDEKGDDRPAPYEAPYDIELLQDRRIFPQPEQVAFQVGHYRRIRLHSYSYRIRGSISA